MLVQLVGGAHLLEPPLTDHSDAIAEIERFFLFVGHKDRGDPHTLDDVAQLMARALAQRGIEVGQRLVQRQHARLGGERARQRHALLLASRQLVHLAPLVPGEIYERQCVRDFGVPLGEFRKAKAHVLTHVQMGKQRVVLKHHAEAAPRRRRRRDILLGDEDATAVRCFESRQQAQHRRLAAARRTEEREDLPMLFDGLNLEEGGQRFAPVPRTC